ncbi:MAG: hypothetical protein EBZ58_08935 [Bacteroidetes bacterium]|nr:hypothetical protein [Bacteroidota bacterium]
MDIRYATSPERGSFLRKIDMKRVEAGDISQEYFDKLYEVLSQADNKNNTSKENDLEWDLRGSQYIVQKCKASASYSQNLYSAMCNNLFFKGEKEWSCSWRYAGGIVADLNEKGDYIDWYCSGIGSHNDGYVGESFVTDEIRSDLLQLGWTIKEYPQSEQVDAI